MAEGRFVSVCSVEEFILEHKQGKGNKPKASVALTSEELKILYEKGLLGIFKHALAKQHSSLCTPWVQRTSGYVLGRCKAAQNGKRSGILGVQ